MFGVGIRGKCPLAWENDGCLSRIPTKLEGTFQMRSSHSLDSLDVIFDDEHLVADAGLVLPATLGCVSCSTVTSILVTRRVERTLA